MNSLGYKAIVAFEMLGAVAGAYLEVATQLNWPNAGVPQGGGLLVSLVSLAMVGALLKTQHETAAIESATGEIKTQLDLAFRLSAGVASHPGVAVPFHENDFYAMWPLQCGKAKNNIDISHLGLAAPTTDGKAPEDQYFKRFVKLVKETPARVRRVERVSSAKVQWLVTLLSELRDVRTFSLALYRDALVEDDMPAAVSVSRIDLSVAWIVALAEHKSTANIRDVMICGQSMVDMLRTYFENRLWNRSIVVIEHGKLRVERLEEVLRANPECKQEFGEALIKANLIESVDDL